MSVNVIKLKALSEQAKKAIVSDFAKENAGKDKELKLSKDLTVNFKDMAAQDIETIVEIAIHNKIQKNLIENVSTPLSGDLTLQTAEREAYFKFIVPAEDDYSKLLKSISYMCSFVQAKHRTLFPLIDGMDGRIVNPIIHVTPAPKFVFQPAYFKGVDTAGVTMSGDIIFNLDFCNRLIAYARYENPEPKSAMYNSNGGIISDDYAYIEFLIMHEFLHVTRGDTGFYNKTLGKFLESNRERFPRTIERFGGDITMAAKRIQNWVADYLNNFDLIKLGYSAPPTGLYSNSINYDNLPTMQKNWEALLEEMENAPEGNHEGKEENEDNHMTQNGDGDGGSNNGSCSSTPPKDLTEEEESQLREKALKDRNELMKDVGQAQTKPEEIKKRIQDAQSTINNNSPEGSLVNSKGFSKESIDKNYTPSFSWSLMVKKMIPINTFVTEESLSRISRRNSAGLKTLADVGFSRAKAGEIKVNQNKKDVIFIIDNSGSVMSQISAVNKEINNLIEKHANGVRNMLVIKFDTDFSIWLVDVHTRRAREFTKDSISSILSVKDLDKLDFKDKERPLSAMFSSEHLGGGTSFGTQIRDIAENFMKGGANTILFTDSDILGPENIKNVNHLIKKFGKVPFKFNIILSDASDYNSFLAHNRGYKYLSHFGF